MPLETPPDPGRGKGQRTDVRGPLLTHSLKLGERVYRHTLVGLTVSGVIVAGALVARYLVGVENLNVTALVLCGMTIAVYYSLAYLAMRRHRDPEASPVVRRRILHVEYATIVLDYLALTVAIFFVGGTRSPFLPFYLLHVIVSCLLLSRRAAIFFHWLAYGLLALFVVGEWSGVLVPEMPQGAVAGVQALDGRYAVTVLVVYAVLFALTAYLLLGLARMLRGGERSLRRANEELNRLSVMRRDFLRIALHNLQSPVGAVTMFLNNMRSGLGGELTETQLEWVNRSLARLKGVEAFMHDLQMYSTLESGRVDVKAEAVDVAAVLRDLVGENQDLAEARGHDLSVDIEADLPAVHGIELLIREAVRNYLTNAIKYTPEGGRIAVRARARTRTRDGGVRIEVQDNGIGIGVEDQARLFSEFVRIRRPDASTAQTKGTGLGLTIVRRVAELHGGRVGVESELDRGSTFYLDLPSRE